LTQIAINKKFANALFFKMKETINIKAFLLFFALSFILSYQSAFNQTLNNQSGLVNFKGTVLDISSGKPIEANITIEEQGNGKKVNTKSNSLTGDFFTILESNKTYNFTFLNFDVYKQSQSAATVFSDNYEEQSHTFRINRLSPGLILFEIDAFDSKTNDLKEDAKDLLNDIESIVKTNRGVKLDILINANLPSNSQDAKASSTKKKKTASNVKSENAHSITDQRVSKLQQFIENNNWFKGKLSISPDYTNSHKHSFTVIVKEIKNPFK
jgi:hypothetical protein